jgi:hypothetical protein
VVFSSLKYHFLIILHFSFRSLFNLQGPRSYILGHTVLQSKRIGRVEEGKKEEGGKEDWRKGDNYLNSCLEC